MFCHLSCESGGLGGNPIKPCRNHLKFDMGEFYGITELVDLADFGFDEVRPWALKPPPFEG